AVEAYRLREGKTAEARLAGPATRLQTKIRELSAFRNAAEFNDLPPDDITYVRERLQELLAYTAFADKVRKVRSVADARSDNDVRDIEQGLAAAQTPNGYAAEWSRTEAVQERNRRLQDLTAVRRAVDDVEAWYRTKRREGERLWLFDGRKATGE